MPIAVLLQELVDPEKGYIKDDTLILEVNIAADAPHGVRYVHHEDTHSDWH